MEARFDKTAPPWLRLVYAGDITGGMDHAQPEQALRLLGPCDDPWTACAVGDEAVLRQAVATDPAWVHRAGGPLNLQPLVAVTHSSLLQVPERRDRLLACAKLLLEAGASPDQSVDNRWPAAPGRRLSALYGAAGLNHDVELARMLLDAGANPDDGESLYHSLDQPACTRLLLQAGARIAGTNAMYRVMDLDDVGTLRMLLEHGGDANEPALGPPTSDWGSPLLWAIYRRRSPAHVQVLLAAGARPEAVTREGLPAYLVALRFGLTEVARLLRPDADASLLPADEAFIAACARGDEAGARNVLAGHPDLLAGLDATQLRLLPDFAALGHDEPVRLMVTLGWPIEARGGDWDASALNHAVFRGVVPLTRFLLDHGADWRALQGFGDDVCGTLAWASVNTPVPGGDWLGCARALLDHGMPPAAPHPAKPGCVLIDGRAFRFSGELTDFLLGA